MSVSGLAELLLRMLEQLADEHGYVSDAVSADAKAWVEAMLEAHR